MKLTFDHICDGLASEVKQRLNVQIVGGLSELLGEEKKKKKNRTKSAHIAGKSKEKGPVQGSARTRSPGPPCRTPGPKG
jgi:hypothetical protein